MKNIKKYNQLLEADIHNNKGLPSEYLDKLTERGKELYGNNPNMHRHMQLLQSIFRIQQGNEEKFEELAKKEIMNQYGSILDNVELDIKIVRPYDSEKREMTQKMKKRPDDQETEIDVEIKDGNFEIEVEVDVNEVDKRKILNILMQGEALNVHSLLYNIKDELDNYEEGIIDKIIEFININKQFYWSDMYPSLDEIADGQDPNLDMANAVEVKFSGGQEEINENPVIKVRALDIVMLFHETIKGIYELIMANALPSENADEQTKEMFRKVIEQTDTLKDEHEDSKYGEFIAADLRDYTYKFLNKHYPQSINIDNIREFVYGGISEMKASIFLDFMNSVLIEDFDKADFILKKQKIVENILNAFDDYNNWDDNDIYDDDDIYEPPTNDTVDYSKMSKRELDNALNQAIDDGDIEKQKEISKYY